MDELNKSLSKIAEALSAVTEVCQNLDKRVSKMETTEPEPKKEDDSAQESELIKMGFTADEVRPQAVNKPVAAPTSMDSLRGDLNDEFQETGFAVDIARWKR